MIFGNFDLSFILIQAPVILLSLTVHEYFHAWTAYKLGDPTAEMQGRLTLNPISHLDPIGTILMFIAGFGWAKPVPINAHNFEDPKKGTLLVAIAGPLSNLGMAIIAGVLLRAIIPKFVSGGLETTGFYPIFIIILILTVVYGVALAIFNMLPIPPLDGSRVVYGILPNKYLYTYSRFEPYGIIFLFALFIFGREIFGYILWYPVSIITEVFAGYSSGELWGLVAQLIR